MVAIAGTGWVLAPSLVAYVKEADRYYPQRDRSADGSIGDLAHQARVSDHNPSDGYVHAVDLDEDLAPGLDLKGFADKLLRRRDPRVKYVIYEGRIFKSYRDSAGHAPWSWMPYTGVNAHLHHLHLSILSTDAARTNTGQWGFAPLVEPKPIAPPEATVYFLKKKGAQEVWFFEPGRYTHVPSSADGKAVAAAAGIEYAPKEVSESFFGRLADGRTRHL